MFSRHLSRSISSFDFSFYENLPADSKESAYGMSSYKYLRRSCQFTIISNSSQYMPATRNTSQIYKITRPSPRNMSILFPRVAFGPARCAPAITRNDFAPLLSLFDDTVNELARSQRPAARRTFTPRFDVKEAKEAYHLEGELPGISQDNITIEFTDEHTLTIKGHSERHIESGSRPQPIEATTAQADGTATPDSASVKSHQPTVEDEEPSTTTETPEPKGKEVEKQPKAESTEPKEQFWFSERSVGEFTRSFSFADRVDQEAVKASLKNGILSIVVPKAPKPQSRRISIE